MPTDSTLALDTATRIASSTTAAEIASAIVDTMSAVFGARMSRVALFENAEQPQRRLTVLMMAGNRAQPAVGDDEPIAIAAASGMPNFSEVRAAIPLNAHDRTIGAFDVEFDAPRSLALSERRFLEHLGRQAGAGLFRIRTEAALRQSERQLREAMRVSRIANAMRDMRTGHVVYSPEMYDLLGVDPSKPVTDETFLARIPPAEAARAVDAIDRAARGEPLEPLEFHVTRPDGTTAILITRANLVADEAGELTRLLITSQDITQQRESEEQRAQLEAQLRQAQKMEAVGQLAGGIAHDFNNLLMIMLGNLDLIEMRDDLPEAERGYLREAHSAAERAIGLTRQLLTFSRRALPRVRPIDLNEVVAHAEKLLARAIGETNAIVLALDPRPSWILGDAGQIEQILLNLAVNARDAMRDGGIVTITTGRTTLAGGERDRWRTLPPGDYIQLSVSDTGEGMTPDVRDRVFDPFFTTKPLGQGTGLGLAMVYGIVTQAHGAVDVQSTPGNGATFTFLFPESTSEAPAESPAPAVAPRRAATVLLVEDEPAVRAVLRATLAKQGFRVVEAQHGRDALLVWREQRASIDIVVTDLRMPEMGGRPLAAALHAEARDLPVIFMSGYDEDALPETEAAGVGEIVLQKPFATADLVARILELLEDAPPRT